MRSVVLPVHNERDNLAPLLAELAAALGARSYEIVAVDDASTDGSLEELRRLRAEYPQLRILRLERHAGQSAALAAGLDAARGVTIVTIDADGQNDPADIPRLLTRLDEDPSLTAVVGYRVRRVDSRWRRLQSRVANRARDWLTGDAVRDTGCGLKVIRRRALRALPRFDGMHRFLPTLVRLGGGAVLELPVAHRPRHRGRSKYSMWNRAARGVRDALGVRWLRRRRLEYVSWEDGT